VPNFIQKIWKHSMILEPKKQQQQQQQKEKRNT
jgi:hypothetical protein